MRQFDPITPEERCVQGRVAVMIGAAALVAWAFAVPAMRHAPPVADLYHLLYGQIGPRKPESTAVFLCSFPLMLSLAFMLNLLSPDFLLRPKGSRQRLPIEGQMAITVLVTAILLVAAIHRSLEVLHHRF